jgi:hypothetical protein
MDHFFNFNEWYNKKKNSGGGWNVEVQWVNQF